MALVGQDVKVESAMRPLFRELRVVGEHLYASSLPQARWKVFSGLQRYRQNAMRSDQRRATHGPTMI